MDEYLLTHFKGKYRVLPHYDQDTKEIPRNHLGEYEESYADFYIPCANKIEIKHGAYGTSELSCYIPSKQRGMNILRQIYQNKINKDLPKDDNTYLDKLCKQLTDKKVLIDVDVLDGEVYFIFYISLMDCIAKLVKAKTSGANIPPKSPKNLPKDKYTIPKNDLELYKIAIENYPKTKMTRDGVEREIVSGLVIVEQNKAFCEKFAKKLDKNEGNLKAKEWIHKCGLWTEYCEFLKERGGL